MGIYDKSLFNELQDYIASGSKKVLSPDEEQYLNALHTMNSMRRKYGRERTISFFQKPPYSVSYYRARQMFDECVNLFYADENADRQALRNMMAEELLISAEVVRQTAKSAKDLEVYASMVEKAYKMKGLDKPEAPKVPDALYSKPIKIYSLDSRQINLEPVDRKALASRIDGMEIPENEKNRIKRDAMAVEIDFIEMLDEQEEKTQFQS